jgi:hypothetical protein
MLPNLLKGLLTLPSILEAFQVLKTIGNKVLFMKNLWFSMFLSIFNF